MTTILKNLFGSISNLSQKYEQFLPYEIYFRKQGVKNNSIIRRTSASQIAEVKNSVIQSVNLFL